MRQDEYTGQRDAHYSVWHRTKSTRRYVGLEDAQLLAMVDIDVALYAEYDDGEKATLALVETARDVGQSFKAATVLRDLAKRADIPAYVALYKIGETPNPANPMVNDIESFRVRQIWPAYTPWYTLTPEQWSKALLRIRRKASLRLDAEDADLVSQLDDGKSA